MQLIKFFSDRRLTWSLIFSIGLHGSVVAALLYVSVEQMKIQPEIEDTPLAVTMVNIAEFAAPQPAAAAPEPVQETPAVPEETPPVLEETPPEPEELPEPVPVPVPEPVKPKPKPVKKEVKKPEVKKTQAPPDDKPFKSDEAALVANNAPVKSAPVASTPGLSTSAGPKALSKAKPSYPARALALGIEGQVKVQYDIDESGRVTNVRVL